MKKKTKKTKKFKFHGWDWSELFEAFGIWPKKFPSFLDDEGKFSFEKEDKFFDDLLSNYLSKRAKEAGGDPCCEIHPEDKKIIRQYIEAHLKSGAGEYGKVWKAMLEIESDIVFIQFFLTLYGHMWN